MKNIFKLVLFVSILALTGISCGVSNIGSMFATETPTPTSTYTPTPTFTPSPTSTSTPTNTPTATPVPGAILEEIPGGFTRFTDFEGGYSFTLPDGWFVLNFVADDPEAVLNDAIQANPDKAVLLNGFQTAIAQKARMGAADFAPDHSTSMSAPFLFSVLDDKTQFMSLEDVLDVNAQMLPQLLNADVTTSDVMENPQGVSYGVLDITITLSAQGTTASVIEKLILFKTSDYTVYVTFAVIEGLEEKGLAGVDMLIDSLELVP